MKLRTSPDEVCHRSGSAGEDVLTVVEDQKARAARKPFREHVIERTERVRTNTNSRRDRPFHQLVASDRRELDQPHSSGISIDELSTDSEGQATLPDTARPDERDDPLITHTLDDSSDVVIAAHKGGQLRRKIVAWCINRSQGSRVRFDIFDLYLEQPHRLGEVAKTV
jgi:hypothetical protein